MKIMVVGAGQVGTSVAKGLDDEHEIVVVDVDGEKLDELRYSADVMTFEGDASDIEVLEEAGAADVDMLIASTDDDRTNILVCAVGEALAGELVSIARVADTDFLKSWQYSRKAFNVDWMVGSDFLTAKTLVQLGLRHRAQAVEHYLEGRIEVVEFELPPDSDLAGQTIQEADDYPGLRYIAVTDGDHFEVAKGDTSIPPEARLLVMGRPREVDELARRLDPTDHSDIERIMVLGGGEIGYQTARLYQQRGYTPRLVEQDSDRANALARRLPDAYVFHDDPLDPEFLQSEGIDRTQLVVTAFESDERNLYAALQAKDLGADRVISVVHHQEIGPMFERHGVDATVNPRTKVIENILRHSRQGRIEKVTLVEGHSAEVMEVQLDAQSVLTGRPLHESSADLPGGMVVGAASRKSQIIIPTGDTTFEVGDRLVIYADTDAVDEVVEKV